MSTVTAEDIDRLEKRIKASHDYAREFREKHPEAPRWAIQVAATIDDGESRILNVEAQEAAIERSVGQDLAERIDSLERAVEAIEKGIESSRDRRGRPSRK
jgi:polyhydroxyalkanoate synthesis regulator phasin